MSLKVHTGETSPRDEYLLPLSSPSPINGSAFSSPNTKKEDVSKVALEAIKKAGTAHEAISK